MWVGVGGWVGGGERVGGWVGVGRCVPMKYRNTAVLLSN